MKYYSLNHESPVVSFATATVKGQAPDKGLYFPEQLPQLPAGFTQELIHMSNEDIAFRVIKPYVGTDIPEEALFNIVSETVSFPIPLVPVTEQIASLELYHGPTLAFKDVGARFMSRCLGYFVQQGLTQQSQQKITVLVATSGDTGGAVANGFYNVPGVQVVILYPAGKVSHVQEKQLTTLGGNIHALKVNGTFDDCQQLVKQAFADAALQQSLFLTSANSINVARWLPQQFYYFFAWKQWKQRFADHLESPVFCVPSGNFGNICAGILACLSGLPVRHFIAACNANDTIPRFLQTQSYEPGVAVPTMSNAMDVAHPSNFVRILELFQHRFPLLKKMLSATSISDAATKDALQRVYNQYRYLLDPHGAVGFLALEQYLSLEPEKKGILLETAHPVKFFDVVEPVIGASVPMPEAVAQLMHLQEHAVNIDASFAQLTDFLNAL